MTTVVVDTNVILVANRQHSGVDDNCVVRCVGRLHAITAGSDRLALDDGYRVLTEYQHKTEPHAGKRAGDVFVKWALRNNVNPARCDAVSLVENAQRGFESFPDDPRLANFDAPDRKFVAVSGAHPDKPKILQATDSKWVDWAPILKEHGIAVDFVCPDDIKRFDDRKKAKKKVRKKK